MRSLALGVLFFGALGFLSVAHGGWKACLWLNIGMVTQAAALILLKKSYL